jgi:multidrug efflux system membrane fusion protein
LVDTIHGTLLVPNAAVQRGAPGTYVYLVEKNDSVKVQPIKIGPGDATNTSVVSGLKIGDQVVIDGADRLRDGGRVNVTNANKDATNAPPGEEPPKRRRRPAQNDESK